VQLKLNEAAVFRWVVIVGIAGATVVAVTLLTRPLVGALVGLVLVIVVCIYGYRWLAQKRREVGSKNLLS
jgi:uncharacterized membrane protein YdcZ (DUF606 family)